MIYVNARYRTHGQGGFVRYSDEVVARLDTPRVLEAPGYARSPVGGRVWEQTVLAGQSRGGLLFSPANSGPLRHPCQVAVIHDVLALQRPDLVSGRFARLQKRFLPSFARGCRRVVVVSDDVADAVVEHCSVPHERIARIPPGVSAVFKRADQFAARGRLGLHADRPVVGAILSSAPRKNSAETLMVLAAVAEQIDGCQAVVVGNDGPPHVFGAAPRPVVGSVVDLGAVDDLTLADFYNALDVFVFLSHGEGFGLPPVEATACGTAVVSTAVPSVTEHLHSAVAVVDGPGEATRSAIALMLSESRRCDIVAAAAEAIDGLTWDRTAHEVADVLHHAQGVLV